MEEKDAEPVGVTLYPADYETVEMVTDQGKEIPQQEFTDAQLFMHSIQELERLRVERKKKKQKTEVEPETEVPAVTETQSNGVKDETADEPMEDAEVEEKTEPKKEAGGEDDAEDEEDVIDPRIHYRPMVAELQAAVAELHQLINSIDLIRRREFLEEMRCIRENTAPKREELEHLVEAKSAQVKEAGSILLDGVEALASTVEKESVFFQGITQMLRKWKVCAPIHGNIPKPFRAGEPLAIDCSYASAGSVFAPQTRSIADLAYAELSRTEKGLVRVKTPEEFLARTIQLRLESCETGKEGNYTLPSPSLIAMSKAELDRLENTPEDLKVLEERNMSVLKAVQFSVFCEELFYTLMQEALQSTSNWTDTAYTISNYAVKKHRGEDAPMATNISVLQVLDDEIQLRVNEKFRLTIKLVDVKSLAKSAKADKEASKDAAPVEDVSKAVDASADVKMEEPKPEEQTQLSNGSVVKKRRASSCASLPAPSESDEAFLTQTCRYTLLLLEQEIRHRHGRKEISRALLYTGSEVSSSSGGGMSAGVGTGSTSGAAGMGSSTEGERHDNVPGTLATVLAVVSHNLLKNEVARYLDEVSAVLAFQNLQVSASGRVLDDGLLQPICDSVRGVYVSPRWKTCAYDSTLSAFDLSIGKDFSTEVLISGTRILFQSGPAAQREVSGVAGLRDFVETAVCSQVALALHRDALSFGLKQASMDLDRTSVRLIATGEWDGSCVGEGRVSDSRTVPSIFLEPYFAPDGSLAVNCLLQAVDVTKLAPVPATLCRSATGEVHKVDWKRIPGASDVGKMVWLMQKTRILPDAFKRLQAKAMVNGN